MVAVASSTTWTDVVRHLGMTALTNRAVRRRIDELGLDTSHLPKRRYDRPVKYTEDALRAAVVESTSLRQVIVRFGSRPVGSVHAHVRRQIDRYGINTDHFRHTTSGRPAHNRNRPEEIFVIRPVGSGRRDGSVLKRAMIEVGVPHQCSECGNTGEWRGKPITLDVDHINGEWRDNRRENLRFLCPNCHSQTETWRSMNHRRRREARKAGLVTSDS